MHSPHKLRSSPEVCRWWLWGGTLVAAVCFAAGNLTLYPMFREQTTATNVYFLAWGGVVLAQIGLGAIWLSLGRPSALIRVSVAVGVLVVLVMPYLTGFLWRQSYDEGQSSLKQQLEAILLIPIVVLAAAAPLWLLRIFFGWHIRHEAACPAYDSQQYSIGSLLVLTTLIASVLAACQQSRHFMREGLLEFWLIVGGWSLAALVIGSLTLIPAALSLTRPVLGLCVLTGVAAAVYVSLVGFIMWALSSFGGNLKPEEIFGIVGFVGCPILDFVLTVAVSLFAVRACGYRLKMGVREEPTKSG